MVRPAPLVALGDGGSTRAWRRRRLAILDRDGWRCQVPVDEAGRIVAAGGRPCLKPADTVDHVLPRTLGGTDAPDNLRAACRPHNLDKGGRLDGDTGPRRPPSEAPTRAWSW